MNKRLSFKGMLWLLLLIFYLRFSVGEFTEIVWSFVSGMPAPQYIYITSVTVLSVLLPLILYLFICSADFKAVLKLNKTSFKNILLSLLVGLSLQPVASLVNEAVKYLLNKINIPVTDNSLSLYGGMWSALIAAAIVPAVVEELLFRGALLTSVEGRGYRWSVFITSFLFALMHNSTGTFAGMFLLGAVSCYAVWMTKSVYCGMAVHFSFNVFNILTFFIKMMYPFLETEITYVIVFVILVLILIFALNALFDEKVKRTVTYNFGHKLLKTILCPPVILMIIGFIFFQTRI